MRTYLLGAAVAAALAVGVPGSASAAPAPASEAAAQHLHGFAQLALGSPALSPDYQITLRMDANGHGSDAHGHATMQHVFYDHGAWIGTVRVEVSVDCLTETDAGAGTDAGATTVVTGTAARISYTTPPGVPPLQQPPRDWHPEAAFSFYRDGDGHLRVGWSGKPVSPTASPVATRCQAPHTGPDLYLAQGGFQLTGA
ncbi:hypothetical protein [Kitasatospora acidiphila]|uniref:hypothetical protein n=1 Tax=Kitasatospora acidiphila TaxID=2567942 RepID=UPI003C734DE1